MKDEFKKGKKSTVGFRMFGLGLVFLTMLPKYPFKSPASSLFLCFILSSHWLVRVRDVNPITSTPKSQWTLADSVSERTVSMDSHSF